MKRFLSLLLPAALLSGGAVAQPLAIYENFGDVTDNPQIDAIAFANYGSFSVFSLLPYDFQSTQYFTNRGTMFGSPGFRFATAASVGGAFRPAINFVNEVGGSITAGDAFGGGIFGGQFGGFVTPITGGGFLSRFVNPSYLLISATNIVNHGRLMAGGGGLMRLTGQNVDLSRSGLGIGRLELTTTHFVTDTTYFPDPGIYDNYWSLTNQFDMGVAGLLQLTPTATNATSPLHAITNDARFQFPSFTRVAVSVADPALGMVSVFTNTGGSDPETGRITNIYRQAVFVAVGDTNLAFDVLWAPSVIATNPMMTATVEIRLADTNVITGDLEFSTLYLRDRLASWTNYTVLTNLASEVGSMRPATFELSRTPPLDFIEGSPGQEASLTNFFFDPRDTNFVTIVTNFYAAYGAEIESIASRPPQVEGLQITDFPGRVEIHADNLDLTRARVRGTALISINTPNLLSSAGVNIDSENVIFNLGVPQGTLNLRGIGKDRVVRLNGPLNAWSAIWTNNFGVTVTNQVEEPAGSGTFTNVVTNLVTEVSYHMLIVDGTGLQATRPVITHDFVTRANNVIVNDPLTVVRSFLVDAESLTLNSRLTLNSALQNWSTTNVPSLRFFTNSGALFVPNVARFGADTTAGWDTFVNVGFISANGILVRSGLFDNAGMLTSRVDGIIIEAQSGLFDEASTFSARDLQIAATDLRFTASTNRSVGRLILTATGSLADSGEGANNLFHARNGFQLPVKPAFGDLLGTTLESIAPRFARVEHIWAGEDRGASATGYENNVAVGQLVLGGDRDSLLSFRGTGAQNAMYVDLLQLTGWLTNAVEAGDLGAALEIAPNMTIYFADSNISPDLLEELSEGKLRRVDFVGAAQYVEVPVRSGEGTVRMERAVRESRILDDDGDGIPNAYDAFPLDFDTPLRLSGTRVDDETSIALTWDAQPQSSYRVEYTTALGNPDWRLLSTFSNPASTAQAVTVRDVMLGNHVQRYYRVRLAE